MNDTIHFERLKTDDQLQNLKRFSEEYDHPITLEDLLFPMYIVSWNDRWIGWIKIFQNVLYQVSWHPNLGVPPRIFSKAFDELKGFAKIRAAETGQIFPGFLMVGDDSTIPDEVVKKLGFEDSGFRLFRLER